MNERQNIVKGNTEKHPFPQLDDIDNDNDEEKHDTFYMFNRQQDIYKHL